MSHSSTRLEGGRWQAACPRSSRSRACPPPLTPPHTSKQTPPPLPGCRFLDGVTGRAGLAQLCDTFVSDPHAHFAPGQSVRAQVVGVDAARERFALTLKQSQAGGADSAQLAALFTDLELAARLGGGGGGEAGGEATLGAGAWDADAFAIGAVGERGRAPLLLHSPLACLRRARRYTHPRPRTPPATHTRARPLLPAQWRVRCTRTSRRGWCATWLPTQTWWAWQPPTRCAQAAKAGSWGE